MSRTYPVDHQARLRLLEAQRAESQAIGDVSKVARRLDSLVARLDAIDLELAMAESDLVSVSGLSRAAELLGREPRELRRRVKLAAQAAGDDRPLVPGRAPDRMVDRCTSVDDVTATHQTAPLRMVWQMRGDQSIRRVPRPSSSWRPWATWAHVQAVAARAASLPFEGGDRGLGGGGIPPRHRLCPPTRDHWLPSPRRRPTPSLAWGRGLGSSGRPPYERQA